MTTPHLLTLLRFSRPLHLMFAALAYILGAGIARYLGIPHEALAFWLGLAGLMLLQASMGWLAEAFRPLAEPLEDEDTRAERLAFRNTVLLVALAALSVVAVLALLLARAGALSPAALLFLALSLALALAYAVPPARLVNAGLGEFALAVHIAMLAPALGFVLQAGEYHRLVGIVSFPLTLLALACFLALDFPTYAADQKYDRRTLLRSMGWERAVPLHHGLALGAYLILAGAPLFGLAWGLVWPAFLTFPFALLQIYLLRNLALGAKPNWKLLTVNALAVFGLGVWLLTFAFWLR
jgi:1,4-dihydroxy-2-naphthoate octaprenyltransferase